MSVNPWRPPPPPPSVRQRPGRCSRHTWSMPSGRCTAPAWRRPTSRAGQETSFSSSRDVAFLEGLERYVGMRRRRPGGFLVAAYEEIAEQALDPRACGTYDPQAYARDPRLVPFDPAARVSWAWG